MGRDLDIMGILRRLVAEPGITATPSEKKTGDLIFEILSGMDYFQENKELLGRCLCPGDGLEREVIYGIVRGNSDKTVVLMGHYDVVGIEDYGKIKDYAFDIDLLPEKLNEVDLDESAAEDLNSGNWIFGRGAADMKAGLAIDIWLTQELTKAPIDGNILFLAVPDEESFSVGMRAASRLLQDLKEKYGFTYELCIDCEPARRVADKHVMSLGTVGKCMPVVMVQGAKAHISMCFDGLNPLGVLSDIFRATELCLDFSDEFDGERTMPPTWNYFKDMKYEYDVSLPIRASGYFSVISYHSTPDETMDKLRKICGDCFDGYVAHMKDVYNKFLQGQKYDTAKGIDYEAAVMTFRELTEYCQVLDGYENFRARLYGDMKNKIDSNRLNLPQATLEMMSRTLDFSGITKPLVLLAFAPPYYSPLRSNNIKGRENKVGKYFEYVRRESEQLYGTKMLSEEYFCAMTDVSYCALDRSFDHVSFGKNTPLWGDIYEIDFAAVESINIPSVLFGPWGKDFHQVSERVYKPDVVERIPGLKKSLIEHIFG